MKKVVGIILILIIGVLIFVGCDNNTINENINNSQGENNLSGNVNAGDNDTNNNANNGANNNENNNVNNSGENVIVNYSKDIDLELIKNSIINTGNINEAKVSQAAEISELYGLQDFVGIEGVLVIDDKKDNYQEIAVIKLANESQSDKILEKFILRYEELLSNENASNVVSAKANIAIKQQAGVGIFIVSANKEKIEKVIDGYF